VRREAVMGLFERFHLSQEEAEARLKRALTGDPTRGEIGLLAALVANKLDEVQSYLVRDATLGADLRDLVAEHLQKARARWETRKAWSVTLPLPIWDEYAREARITGRSITECLVSAVRRDYDRKKGTLEPLETLDQNVRAFHAAATPAAPGRKASARSTRSSQRDRYEALPDRERDRGAHYPLMPGPAVLPDRLSD
jgi:hypothetical protein